MMVLLAILASCALLQQRLGIRMHAIELLRDRMLWPVLLLRQPLDPPDLGQELADLLHYVLAVLLGHEFHSSDISTNAIL